MAATTPGRARLAARLLACMLGAAVALSWTLSAASHRGAIALLGGLGVALLALACLADRPTSITWGIAMLGGQYAVWLSSGDGGIDAGAPLVAGALFAATELLHESQSLSAVDAIERSLVRRVAIRLALSALLAVAASAVFLAVGLLAPARGNALITLGLVAAALLMALLSRLTARADRAPGG